MPVLDIILDGDASTPELRDAEVHHFQSFKVTALPGGMQSGKPSVAFVIGPLPDGSYVFAETSMVLFQAAARAFAARYGDVLE